MMFSKMPYWVQDMIEKQTLGYGKYSPGELAMKKLVSDYLFQTVLDIGCGDGAASKFFKENGKSVTACDYGKSINFDNSYAQNVIIGDFMQINFPEAYDCVWCCHCLEHQLDVHSFLRKIHLITKEGGVLAITVPPSKNTIVGGHVSIWNAGLILYRLVLAGFDCSHASIKRYGYNISVIVEKRTIDVSDKLVFDKGDIRTLTPYFPSKIKMRQKEFDNSFYGKIQEINW